MRRISPTEEYEAAMERLKAAQETIYKEFAENFFDGESTVIDMVRKALNPVELNTRKEQ